MLLLLKVRAFTGVEGGEGEVGGEGPGLGRQVQTIATRNDPASGKLLLFLKHINTIIIKKDM